MKRILISFFTIGVLGSSVFGMTKAFFSDTEKSTGNTFTAGSLDLKINDTDNPTAIVAVADLKPGDTTNVGKSLKIIDNPARVWMHLKDFVNGQGVSTQSETIAENPPGGPKSDIESVLDYDLTIGDAVIIAAAAAKPMLDVQSCWIPLGTLSGNQQIPMTQSFHMDASTGNWAQGDTLTFTEEFYAQQVADTSTPQTASGRIWNGNAIRCEESSTPKPLYNSNSLTCTGGASETGGPTFGTVTLVDTGSSIEVQAQVTGGTASSSYDIWLNQDPGGCPQGGPIKPGAIVTDELGNGTGTATAPKVSGATNYWISAVGGGQVLRSTAVSF